MKTCHRCHAPLPHKGGRGCPERPSRKRRQSRKARPSKREERIVDLPVWGIDSEEQEGRTVLLAGATESGAERWVEDPSGLDSVALLNFLLSLPKGLKVSFAFNYDVTMILRDLPFSALDRLRREHVVYLTGWTIRHIPGKRFWIKKRETGESCQVWDVWSWWARSFAHLLDKWPGLTTPEETDFVRRMKELRDVFSELPLSEIRSYCLVECRSLARWVRNLIDLHERVGLKLRSYCGPGSTASAIYARHGWKPPERSDELISIGTAAFYGGRNEVSAMGPIVGPVYRYDIGSAYPFEISRLPGITGWTSGLGDPGPEWWGFGRVAWNIPRGVAWGPFPVRGAITRSGRALSLVYPLQGEGWYHSSEIEAARRAFGSAINVREYRAAKLDGSEPFAWVRSLAAERLRLKAEGAPEAYPLKVGLNSLYGKMVQRAGRAPFRDVVYGAAVTAGTRARLLEILVSKGRDALLAATDGILTLTPVEGLDIGTELGQWEVDIYPEAWIAQSGVYWLGDEIKTRGFRKRSLSLEDVRDAWAGADVDGYVKYAERRFIGYRLATARNRPEQLGIWQEPYVDVDGVEHGYRHLYLSPYPRRQPAEWNGATLHTDPPTLAEWKVSVAIDEAILAVGRHDDETTLTTIEDPEWMLDDAS